MPLIAYNMFQVRVLTVSIPSPAREASTTSTSRRTSRAMKRESDWPDRNRSVQYHERILLIAASTITNDCLQEYLPRPRHRLRQVFGGGDVQE